MEYSSSLLEDVSTRVHRGLSTRSANRRVTPHEARCSGTNRQSTECLLPYTGGITTCAGFTERVVVMSGTLSGGPQTHRVRRVVRGYTQANVWKSQRIVLVGGFGHTVSTQMVLNSEHEYMRTHRPGTTCSITSRRCSRTRASKHMYID